MWFQLFKIKQYNSIKQGLYNTDKEIKFNNPILT